jgi:dienelactone hydrolase
MNVTTLRATLAAAITLAAAPAAQAATPAFPTDACAAYGDQRVCTAQVPSFDGAPLDVDLTLPGQGTAGPHPLVVLLHGFGNDKHEWQSTDDEADGADKWRWNSHWFSRRGFYVLTATARGFHSRPASQPYQPPTPAGTSVSAPSGTIQLKSREVEVRDTQWLAAVVAATFPDVDRNRVAVSGNSYGGGETWLLASEAEWTFPHERVPALPVLRLRAAVPKYTWTDLGYGLAPGGHGPSPYLSSTGRPESPDGAGYPVGAVKLSYVNGFFALGTTGGVFEHGTRGPTEEGPIDITAWRARLADAGDPYDAAGLEDPLVRQARRGLTEFRGSYYLPERWRAQARAGQEVGIFSAQGWTDDLFTSVESFRQYRQLKAIDPAWPVVVAMADVGHSRARNPAGTWRRLNARANAFVDARLAGAAAPESGVTSERSVCSGDAADGLRASTPEGLATGAWTTTFPAGALAPGSGDGDPDGVATDPIVGPSAVPGECRTSVAPEHPLRYTARSAPLRAARTYVGIGTVELPYALDVPATTTVAARLWDEASDGSAVLVDRGVYRIDPPAYDGVSGRLRIPLYGNHWRFAAGHRLRLDLVQADAPSLRRPNVPNRVTFDAPRLRLPVR